MLLFVLQFSPTVGPTAIEEVPVTYISENNLNEKNAEDKIDGGYTQVIFHSPLHLIIHR